MKRWKYSLEELNCLYERLVAKAIQKFNNQDYNSAVKCIKSAANFQYHFNNIYNDKRLDNLLEGISTKCYYGLSDYESSDFVFFYDSFCLDNRGLTQHYLDALVHNGKFPVVYILESYQYEEDNDILQFLHAHDIKVKFLPNGSWKDKCDYIYSLILEFKPKAALFHLLPYSIVPFISFYPFKAITKYQINLTDHAFWLGSPDFFDYSFEFRNYGMTISLDKRGFHKKQLLLNPFYPWQSGMPFQGFPIDVRDKVVIFSGGAMYKIEGDNDMYYRLVKSLLDTYPNTVLFYAGSGNSVHLEKFISENKYEERLILLGNRKDIDEVFKNCDIYLSTYPVGGGLMAQYAAINSKPILLYKSTEIEKEICTKRFESFKLDSIDDFVLEAGKLIKNKDYRLFKGSMMRSLVYNQNDFRTNFSKSFLNTILESANHDNQEEIKYFEYCLNNIDRINNNIFGLVEKLLIKNYVLTIKVIVNTVLYGLDRLYIYIYKVNNI